MARLAHVELLDAVPARDAAADVLATEDSGVSVFVGVDPGRQGAMAVLNDLSGMQRVNPLPLIGGKEYDLNAIAEELVRIGIALACVEKLDAMPARLGGSYANFARGESRGWAWMLTALRIPYQLVPPRTWQKVMLAGTPTSADTKTRSIMAAQRLFPGVSLLPSPRAKKPSDGMSDALLLAEYARRVHSGGAA